MSAVILDLVRQGVDGVEIDGESGKGLFKGLRRVSIYSFSGSDLKHVHGTGLASVCGRGGGTSSLDEYTSQTISGLSSSGAMSTLYLSGNVFASPSKISSPCCR